MSPSSVKEEVWLENSMEEYTETNTCFYITVSTNIVRDVSGQKWQGEIGRIVIRVEEPSNRHRRHQPDDNHHGWLHGFPTWFDL